jgi:hypothetical protein
MQEKNIFQEDGLEAQILAVKYKVEAHIMGICRKGAPFGGGIAAQQ